MEFSHIPVLFDETIDSLDIKANGLYVDCTCGGAGHSSEILRRLDKGHLIAIDRDPDAIEVIKERIGNDPRVETVHDSFNNIKAIMADRKADGILADLGVSSFQLDNPDRGFSFHSDAKLDMRMSKKGKSAYDVVNNYSYEELANILFKYGEEQFARKIAKNIVESREESPIETTLQLAEIIKMSYPAKFRRNGHPARKSFQAIRIEVNDELSTLAEAVEDMFSCLRASGRLSIITFHSLEDKTVKEKFREFTQGCTCPKDFPVCVCGKKPRGKIINRGLTAKENELSENQRSRSARLRTIEKID